MSFLAWKKNIAVTPDWVDALSSTPNCRSIQQISSQPLWLYFLVALSCRLSKGKLCKNEIIPWHCPLSLFVPIFKMRRQFLHLVGHMERQINVELGGDSPRRSQWTQNIQSPPHEAKLHQSSGKLGSESSTPQLAISNSWQCLLTPWKLWKTHHYVTSIHFHSRKVC